MTDTVPGSDTGGPPPGILGTADRLGRALAGGTGLREPGADRPPTPREARRNLTNLAIGLAALVAFSYAVHGLVTLVVVVALLGFVMLHELGHLITAKRSGMKVTEYFVGFGPRLWSIRRGGTEYGIKAIPAGGYVRIVGMNNLDQIDPADEPRSYRAQSFPRRLVVALAGSTVHFLIALVLLFALNTIVGVTNYDKPLLRISEIDGLTTGESPAQRAGLRPGDVIVGVDGTPVKTFDDLKNTIVAQPGVLMFLDVQRGDQRLTLAAVPANLQTVTPTDKSGKADTAPAPTTAQGFLGVVPVFPKDRTDPITGIGRTGVQFGRDVVLTLKALGSIFSPHGISSYGHQLFGNAKTVTPSQAASRPVSAVGIVRVTSQAAKQGAEPVLTILMALNVFIGVFNLIPLPPFDGGLVAVAVYERIRSRRGERYRVDMARLLPVAYGVFLLLVFVFVSSLYLDITRPL